MSQIYAIRDDGSTLPMQRVQCRNEDIELQRLLEKNLSLIPGDQVDPEDPRRWLLIKREMPVPDPNTGGDRWSIDFFLVDQDAMPTFVECKRFADTRARREIVGQMFEYAANGHYYWTKEAIRDYAEESAKACDTTLESELPLLLEGTESGTDEFFERVQENLREGQVRIVFFLERAPMELRSVVDFLNKQLERSEVLLVEAEQYSLDGMKVVAPRVFGYTEQARQVKRVVTVTSGSTRRKWDERSFFEDARKKLSAAELAAVESLFKAARDAGCGISWGTGKNDGSYNIKANRISSLSFLTVRSNGSLSVNYGWLAGPETVPGAQESLKHLIETKTKLPIPADYASSYPGYSISKWRDHAPALIEVVSAFAAEEPAS